MTRRGYLRGPWTSSGRSCTTCGTSIRAGHFYCRSHWWQLIALLRSKIELVAFGAEETYVGRTCKPDYRRQRHHERSGRDQLTILHSSDEFEEIVAIEETLIEKLDWHPKLANKTTLSWGGERPDRRNWIYVSWRRHRMAEAAGVETLIEEPEKGTS
jgi:hypothetical protein